MKLFYAFTSLLLVFGLAHGQIRIGGSDLLTPNFDAALTEYADSRDLDLTIDFTGSYPGMEGLKKGSLDLAVVAIPVGGDLPGEGLRAIPFASKVLAIAVPQANPLNQITMQQLAAIFGESEASNITRWGQLGLTGEWSSRSIAVASVSQAQHTLALDLFRHQVLQSRNTKPNLSEAPDINSLRRFLSQDNSSIALLHRIPADGAGMKILPIARTNTDLAFGPNPETVANNDYPLVLPLYLVFPTEGAGELKDLLRYMVSEEAAEALEGSDLTPLPSQQRQRLYLEFERF